ncbi:MAG: hypothetical protein JST41_11785 [Bacteroidetes bacterium]|nr:hypothetical protein [Bacteroidota bacterium]MBX7128656.1 hypothetical protein [Flavobacteriales bacterium]HMU12941.1 hypothetical protein [Flavobacteriales bacterium]HMW96157.1 hypothetical protein [Flavobacteriales bacterium]HMZ48077.1 hypothetical protein [Flavobacteriales bacterium]
MSQSRPFSKLKKQVEALFVPGLDLRVDCFVHAHRTQRSEVRVPRYTLKLGEETIWHFPGDLPLKRETPHVWPYMVDISGLLRAYLDTPVDALLSHRFEQEQVDLFHQGCREDGQHILSFGLELTPVLIAADRRLGRAKLAVWAAQFQKDHAVHQVLKARAKVAQEVRPGG